MIGWYVDVGAFTYSGTALSHVNDIDIYDYNRPFTFGTNWPIGVSGSSAGADKWIAAREFAAEHMGNDFNTIYGIKLQAVVSESQTAYIVIPSLRYGYPNINNTDRNVDGSIMFIFRGLKRVLSYSRSNNYAAVYRINDDGSLSSLGSRLSSSGICRFNGTTSLSANISIRAYSINGYTNGMKISDISQFVDFSTGYDTGGNVLYSFSSMGVPAWFNLVFNTEESGGILSPDFNEDGVQNDPFDPVDPSEPGTNPPGTFDDESDPIPDSPLPSISAADTGFTRIYNPSLSQVQALARYLWTEPSVIDTIWNHIKQFFEDPMQAIIGFNLVPCRIQNGPTTSFKLMFIDTGVEMTTAANQFVDVDCGILQVEPYYGSALDYSPYTKTSLFLPYVGMVSLDTDEIMGNELAVKYRIDICSGSCVAKVFIDGNCMYQFSGHCAISIPINSADFSGYVQAAIGVAKLGIAYAAGSAMTAAAALSPSPKQTTSNTSTISITKTERNPATGRQITTGTSTRTVTNEGATYKSSFDSLTPSNISNTVGNIMGSKAHVEHAGSFSGNTGYLGVRRPYLLIERPNMCRPASWASMNGYPAMITMKLGDCKGFTKVQQVYLCGTRATQAEDDEILSFLKSGVIL